MADGKRYFGLIGSGELDEWVVGGNIFQRSDNNGQERRICKIAEMKVLKSSDIHNE